MPSGSNLVHRKFGRITVLRETATEDIYLCRCRCGRQVELYRSQLTKGVIRHCGCLATSGRERHVYTQRPLRYKHIRYCGRPGFRTKRARRTGEYMSYLAMINRCCYKTLGVYKEYGGRGITVDPRWRFGQRGKGFVNFLDDMGARPVNTSLDRIDVQGHYRKSNCRWASQSVQAQNQRRHLFEEGKEPPVAEVPKSFEESFEESEELLAGVA
jgi:hypothetical protein